MVSETDPYLKVNEITLGSGGLCGSVYLNKRFEELVRGSIGAQLDLLSKSESLEAMDEVSLPNLTSATNYSPLYLHRSLECLMMRLACHHSIGPRSNGPQIKPAFGQDEEVDHVYYVPGKGLPTIFVH